MMRGEADLDGWFAAEILPLEPLLMHFLRRNWHAVDELPDIRQDVYVKVYDAARRERPDTPKAFLISVARNHLINLGKRARIVSFETAANMEAFGVEEITPERLALARDELRLVRDGLEKLPRRCRQVVELRKFKGLSQNEVASQMGIGVETVRRQLALGMRALADHMLGGDGRIQRDLVQPALRKYRSWR